jgi:hypothetical protein
MNPLRWHREHQIALALSIGIGILIGGWLSWGQIRDCAIGWTNGFGYLDVSGFLTDCKAALFVKPILGGAIGGGIVYIRQLLHTPH